MQLVILIGFVLVLYVGASIVRTLKEAHDHLPPKKGDVEGKKALTRRINTTKERVE
jgi:hypothetical protein